ncbi:hypothetical protein PX52LOC_00251 [Limnoglobus roseus]|uniref:Uncharacterized protein n=1 Tax=Limnoglobus roseus TaxID=2598579 RepID=A0A5C1A4R7_9BACT|nr:hypothetical protein PX52LOC_00251 [Limnoglobus roseus]
MHSEQQTWYRRWTVLVPGLAASLIPTLMLTAAWAQPSRRVLTFFAFWDAILAGPITYTLSVLNGQTNPNALHSMKGLSAYVYAICLAIILTHPVVPRPITRRLAVAGFVAWYVWAFLVINGYEY